MNKYLLLIFVFISQIFANENSEVSVKKDLFESNSMQIEPYVIEKQLRTKLKNQPSLSDDISFERMERYFKISGKDQKVCIGGIKSGEKCEKNSDCDTLLCDAPFNWYETNVNEDNILKQTGRLNEGFTFELGLETNFTCNGFTVGFMEKIDMLVAAIQDYFFNHFLKQLPTKILGIPSSEQPGALMKWAVDVMIQLGCAIKGMTPATIKTAGSAVITGFKESLSTLESVKECATGMANHGYNAGKQICEQAFTSTNSAAASKTKSSVLEEGLFALGAMNQDCLDESRKFFDDLMNLKLNKNIESELKKHKETMCKLSKTEKESHKFERNIFVDVTTPPSKSYSETKTYFFGLIKVYRKDTNNVEEEKSDLGATPPTVTIDYDDIEEVFQDSGELVTNNISCLNDSNSKSCTNVQSLLIDISKCIKMENNKETVSETIENGSYKNICSAISCNNSKNPYCFKAYKFDGKSPEYTETNEDGEEIVDDEGVAIIKQDDTPETKMYKYIPYIPFDFKTLSPSAKVRKSLLEKAKRKKDICLYLQGMGKVQKYRMLNSYIVAKKLLTMTSLNKQTFEKNNRKYLLNLDEVEREYNTFVEDYCVRQLDLELKNGMTELEDKIEAKRLQMEKLKIDIPLMYKKYMFGELYIYNDPDKNVLKACTYEPTTSGDTQRVHIAVKNDEDKTINITYNKVSGKTIQESDGEVTDNGKGYKYSTENGIIPLPLVLSQKPENLHDHRSEVTSENMTLFNHNKALQDEIDYIIGEDKSGYQEAISFVKSLSCVPYWGAIDYEESPSNTEDTMLGDKLIEKYYKAKKGKTAAAFNPLDNTIRRMRKEKQDSWFGSATIQGSIESSFRQILEDVLKRSSVNGAILKLMEREKYEYGIYIRD